MIDMNGKAGNTVAPPEDFASFRVEPGTNDGCCGGGCGESGACGGNYSVECCGKRVLPYDQYAARERRRVENERDALSEVEEEFRRAFRKYQDSLRALPPREPALARKLSAAAAAPAVTEVTVSAARPEKAENELTDHNYDGIQEYDNPTPGWWHALFILTIVFSVFYVAIYHFSPFVGTLPERHAAAVQRAEAAQFSELAAMPTDEAKIVKIMHNESWLEQGAAIFTSSCTLCHKADGSGSIGPNLTDNVYKNCTDLMSMYDVVLHGMPNAGMPAKGGAQLNENEVVLVTAYVASLRNTNVPGGKAPEGIEVPPFPTLDADGNVVHASVGGGATGTVATKD